MQWQGEPDWDALDSAVAILKNRPNDVIREFERLAELGSLLSMFYLAGLSSRGELVPRDEAKALYWYKRAADGGLIKAEYYLGRHYIRKKRYDEGIALLVRASDVNYAPATNALAFLYFCGIGVAKNYEQARTYWERAISREHLLAKRDMAAAMITGAFGSNLIIKGIWLYLKAIVEILLLQNKDNEGPNSDRII